MDVSGIDLQSIAVQGIDLAQTQLEAAASGIASAASFSPEAATVDLSAEVVALLSARNQFDVGLATLKIAGEVLKSAVDVVA